MAFSLQASNSPISSLHQLQELFHGFVSQPEGRQSTVADPIILSFDIGGGASIKGFTEIGVAIFDTRMLSQHDANPECNYDPIKSFNYCMVNNNNVNSHKNRRARKANRLFLFGESQLVAHTDKFDLLTHIFRYEHSHDETWICCGAQKFRVFLPNTDLTSSTKPSTGQRHRPIILVGHDVRSDLWALKNVGFEIEQHAPISIILDTQVIAKELYGGNRRLGDLCHRLNIHCKNLHNSGNDATYTLLALLKMSVEIIDMEKKVDRHLLLFRLIQILDGRQIVRKVTSTSIPSSKSDPNSDPHDDFPLSAI